MQALIWIGLVVFYILQFIAFEIGTGVVDYSYSQSRIGDFVHNRSENSKKWRCFFIFMLSMTPITLMIFATMIVGLIQKIFRTNATRYRGIDYYIVTLLLVGLAVFTTIIAVLAEYNHVILIVLIFIFFGLGAIYNRISLNFDNCCRVFYKYMKYLMIDEDESCKR